MSLFGKVVFFLIGVHVFVCWCAIDTTIRVDTTLFRFIDLTHDGQKDTVTCHLKGESWTKPLIMHITIKSMGKTIYREKYDTDFYDFDFRGEQIHEWCDKGYLICKQKWFFEHMWSLMFVTVPSHDEKRQRLFDSTSNTAIPYAVFELFRDTVGYSSSKAKKEADLFTEKLKKKSFSCLGLPVQPFSLSFPQIYVDRLKRFVVLYCF